MFLDIAFIARRSVLNDPLTVMRIHSISRHANGVGDDGFASAVMFSHHVAGFHSTRFANVHLW